MQKDSPLIKRLLEMQSHLWQTLKLVWDSSRKWTIASAILMILQGILPILTLYFTGQMIDTITAVINGNGVGTDRVILFVVLVAGVTLFTTVLNTLNTLVSEGQTLLVADHVLGTVHAKSVAVGLEYYENAQYYNRMHRIQQDIPYRPPQIVNSLLQSTRDLFTLIGIVGLLLWFNVSTLLILFLSALPAVLVRMRFSKLLVEWRQRSAETERRAFYMTILMTYEKPAKEVRLFNLGKLLSDRFTTLRAKLRRERLNLVSRQVVQEVVVQGLAIFALFFAFYLVILDALSGTLTIGMVVIAFQAFQRGQTVLQSLLGNLASLYENSLVAKDYYDFLAIEEHTSVPANPKSVPQPMREGICFENVTFRYSQSSDDILKGVNLTIKPGQIIALVGENGAGKTTLIKLLCRLYDPTHGHITLDGVDLREFDVNDLRRAITALFQDYMQYQLEAWENIWFGNIDLPPEKAHLIKAAKASGAHEVISDLPQGYESPLGNWFGGHELSIGQWQKIALARAFLRDAQLVILDEPTSSLDVMAEHAVFERFRQIVKGRSAVLISHRLSTIRMADRIYVLKDGCIVEDGSHDELMQLNKVYAQLFNTQSQYYR